MDQRRNRRHYQDLQICEDLWQQKLEWRIERVAWFLLYLLLAGIVFGLLGQGPLATARLEGADGATRMEYHRFLRNKSSARLKIMLPPSSGEVRVALDKRYLAALQLKEITPEPEKVLAQTDALAFVFNAETAQPVEATFHIEPSRAGWLDGWVAVGDGARQPFRQFVYP